MPEPITHPTAQPRLKAGVHGTLAALAALCCLYSLVAYLRRRETHLAINATLYGLWTAYEVFETAEHVRHADTL